MTKAVADGSIYRRKRDGLWVGALCLPNKQRRYVYGRTRNEARTKLRAERQRLEMGLRVGDASQSLNEYLGYWLDEILPARIRAGRLRNTTAASYADMVRLHIKPLLGHVRLSELRPHDLRTWLMTLETRPQVPRCPACRRTLAQQAPSFCERHRAKVRSEGWPRLSPRTTAYAHGVLRNALADAVREELVFRNVATLVRPPAVPKPHREPMTADEAATLLKAADHDALGPLWLLLIGTGLRKGEALALRWTDVDLDERTLTVARAVRRVRYNDGGGSKWRLEEAAPKTASSCATIAVPGFVCERLRKHRVAQLKRQVARGTWDRPDLVFTTSVGSQLDPDTLLTVWGAFLARAGLRRFRIHDLRHAAATLLYMQGADLKAIQATLRHSRLQTTADIYTHVLVEVQRRAADKMDEFLRTSTER
jgi:integrase